MYAVVVVSWFLHQNTTHFHLPIDDRTLEKSCPLLNIVPVAIGWQIFYFMIHNSIECLKRTWYYWINVFLYSPSSNDGLLSTLKTMSFDVFRTLFLLPRIDSSFFSGSIGSSTKRKQVVINFNNFTDFLVGPLVLV